MKPVTRLLDKCSGGFKAAKGSLNVIVNNKPWHRNTDQRDSGTLASGSKSVLVNNLNAGRVTDVTSIGTNVVEGSTDTLCGG